MRPQDAVDLFSFMKEQVEFTARKKVIDAPYAFPWWFLEMYFLKPHDVFVSDGSYDGKIDAFFRTDDGRSVRHHVLNCKYTDEFNRQAPVQFYDEIIAFKHVFENKDARDQWLASSVKKELVPHYANLFKQYDAERADLIFLTNCRRNARQFERVRGWEGPRIIHLEDLLQYVVDDYDVAMPETPPLTLQKVPSPLTPPDTGETRVPTSIVFARLIDFIHYLERDPYNLLLARNVRVYKGNTPTNKAIRDTFQHAPEEFVFSHNGITVLCDKTTHDMANLQLELKNPRVVNGGQTLLTIRDVPNPSPQARVMLRIITIERSDADPPAEYRSKRDIISKIAERSNMQNPIERWDLRSFDDYQLELYRFFRRRDFFYERRPGEWKLRRRELTSVGVQEGPTAQWLCRLIASYYYDVSQLGPVKAKRPAELAEDDPYARITRAAPELAYQIWYVGEFVVDRRWHLARQKKRIGAYKGSMDMTLVSLVVRCLRLFGAPWGKPSFTNFLEAEDDAWDERNADWGTLVRACVKMIDARYRDKRETVWKRSGEYLEHGRYFKNQSYVSEILDAPLGAEIRRYAQHLAKGWA